MLGQLDGEARHPAGAALDQDRFAGLQLQRVLDRTERGETGERQSRGLDMRQAAGLLRDDGGADGDLLGIGPFPAHLQNTEHFIADARGP